MLIRAAEYAAIGCLKDITADYLQMPSQGVLNESGIGYIYPPPECLANIVQPKFPWGWRILGWGDVVDLYFQCTQCGSVFSLHAETYHGRGGAWEYLETSPQFFRQPESKNS